MLKLHDLCFTSPNEVKRLKILLVVVELLLLNLESLLFFSKFIFIVRYFERDPFLYKLKDFSSGSVEKSILNEFKIE